MDIWVYFYFWLLCIMCNEHSYRFSYGYIFSFLLGILCLGLELLAHVTTLFNTFRNCQTLPKQLFHFSLPTAMYKYLHTMSFHFPSCQQVTLMPESRVASLKLGGMNMKMPRMAEQKDSPDFCFRPGFLLLERKNLYIIELVKVGSSISHKQSKPLMPPNVITLLYSEEEISPWSSYANL